MRLVLPLSLVALALAAVGCEKTYDVRFQGVSLPGEVLVSHQYDKHANITQNVGSLTPGSTLKHKFKVDEKDTPGLMTWYAETPDGQVVASGKQIISDEQDQPILVRVDAAAGGAPYQPGPAPLSPDGVGRTTIRGSASNGRGTVEAEKVEVIESEPEMEVTPD